MNQKMSGYRQYENDTNNWPNENDEVQNNNSNEPVETHANLPKNLIDVRRRFVSMMKTPIGPVLVINILLLFVSWCITLGWRSRVTSLHISHSSSSFFLITTILPCAMLIILMVFFLLGFHLKTVKISWPLVNTLACSFWSSLLLVSSLVMSINAIKYSEPALGVVAGFGIFATFGLALQSFIHFKEFRS